MSDADTTRPEPPRAQDTARWDRLIVSLVALVLSAAGFVLLLVLDLSAEKLALGGTFLGVIFGWSGAAIQFYLGSSQGSSGKDTLLSQLAGLRR